MKISETLAKGKSTLSFEVFPPKTAASYESVSTAALEIAKLNPDFMSVTYGAGGGTSVHTVKIASAIQELCGVPALAHLTCVSSTKKQIEAQLVALKDAGIQNILALRGDIPAGADGSALSDYRHANELITFVKAHGDFCVGGACYPEGHPESATTAEDIDNLKRKIDAGCSFLTTQMFFDNNLLYRFMYKIREKGITVPIVAGIMPCTNGSQISRICALSGTYLPARFKAIVDKFGANPAAMRQAGIAYACEQIIDLLANGIQNIHVYSMNKPDIASAIHNNLSELL